MISYERRGEHVQIRGHTRTHAHVFDGSEKGVVLGETDDGLGGDRRLMSIQWEGSVDFGPVFSSEVLSLEHEQ